MPRSSTARARLVQSAASRIHASSYATASVEELCADAGVQKGSFYYFFPSKRDLALAAIDDQWANTTATILEPAFAADGEPLERIARFFRSVADHQRADVVLGCPFGNLAAELGTQDHVIRDRVRQVFAGYQAYFEHALREAAADGKLRESDVPVVARALLAYFQGALLLAKTHNDAAIIETLADRAVNLVVGTPRKSEAA
jgi:TetR/AcrR family transcriptional regulator, transcriptional repressor for nem operon